MDARKRRRATLPRSHLSGLGSSGMTQPPISGGTSLISRVYFVLVEVFLAFFGIG